MLWRGTYPSSLEHWSTKHALTRLVKGADLYRCQLQPSLVLVRIRVPAEAFEVFTATAGELRVVLVPDATLGAAGQTLFGSDGGGEHGHNEKTELHGQKLDLDEPSVVIGVSR